MPMTTTYTTVNGQILHENRSGTETELVPDPLGSVVQTRSPNGSTTSSSVYWPYGETRTSTGTNPTPWGYVGSYGYRKDTGELTYVRARHYRPGLARWQTVDPLWPLEQSYRYAHSSPTFSIDPTGFIAIADDIIIIGGAIIIVSLINAYYQYQRISGTGPGAITWPLPQNPFVPREPACAPQPMADSGDGKYYGPYFPTREQSPPRTRVLPIPLSCDIYRENCEGAKSFMEPMSAWQRWQWDKMCSECYAKCLLGGVGVLIPLCDYWNLRPVY